MSSVMGFEPRFRKVNLMSDEPEMRELQQIIARRALATGYLGTQADSIPIAVFEQVMEASIAEFNARVMARNALSSTRKQ